MGSRLVAAEAAEDAPVLEHTEEGLPLPNPVPDWCPVPQTPPVPTHPPTTGITATAERTGATTAMTR